MKLISVALLVLLAAAFGGVRGQDLQGEVACDSRHGPSTHWPDTLSTVPGCLNLAAPAAAPNSKTNVTVDTTLGSVVGELDADTGIASFRGIPFAEPPVGHSRFRPPQPVKPWSQPLEALFWGPACPQNDQFGAYGKQGESCLVLNIFTPSAHLDASTPVMLFFYGGSFNSGSSSLFLYEGSKLAQSTGQVIVTANYRIGALGFLVLKEMMREGGSDWPTGGNYGILDQRLAIQWVRSNIASFGGDPRAITVFGESAGSISTCLHMLHLQLPAQIENAFSQRATADETPFQRAILESGSCAFPQNNAFEFFNMQKAMDASEAFATELGCPPDNTGCEHCRMDCLRAANVSSILATYQKLPEAAHISPIVDFHLVPDHPMNMFEKGQFYAMDVLGGTTRDEGTMFIPDLLNMTESQFRASILDRFDIESAQQIFQQYPLQDYPQGPGYAMAALTGDASMTCPTRRLLNLLATHSHSSQQHFFLYEWEHVPSWIQCPGFWCSWVPWGVFHSAELFNVFGNAPPFSSFTEEETRFTGQIMQLWNSFARDGQPRLPSSATDEELWQPYTVEASPYLALNASSLTPMRDYRRSPCDLWDRLGSASDKVSFSSWN